MRGVVLVHRRYRRLRPEWDHDHCAFCSAKFMAEDLPDVLREGYCTEDEYHWICKQCFTDFKDRFSWVVREEGV